MSTTKMKKCWPRVITFVTQLIPTPRFSLRIGKSLQKAFFFQSRVICNSKSVYDERPKCQIERRKRNLIFISPVSRREREIQNNLSSFEKRKRILSRNCVGNLHFFSVSRRERKF